MAIIGATHIGVFNIINHIKEKQNQNESIFISIERGDRAPLRNLKDMQREDRIQTIIRDRNNNRIETITFLRRIARNLTF